MHIHILGRQSLHSYLIATVNTNPLLVNIQNECLVILGHDSRTGSGGSYAYLLGDPIQAEKK